MSLDFNTLIERLIKAEVKSPRLEARIMLAEVKGIEIAEVSVSSDISAEEEIRLEQMLEQRSNHRPLDKILGHREFYKYDFLCNDNVLSPRSDTEILVEQAAKLIFKQNLRNVLDLGVGSGCVLFSLLADFPFLSGVGIDVSLKALEVAGKNALRLGVQNRVQLISADWNNENFCDRINKQFDIIVSNPPYIPSAEISMLAPEVKNFDPLLALDGGLSGYDAYEKIVSLAPKLLKNNGYLLFEAGYNQAQKIKIICENCNFEIVDVVNDLSGIERCVISQKKLAK